MAPQNQAAWLTAKQAKPLKVADAPLPSPGPGEVSIKTAAVAINPVDWKIQDQGVFVQTYPNVLGTDLAGVVEEVGEGVTRLRKGQRVISHSRALLTGDPAAGAFQRYVKGFEILTSPIPDSLPFENAVVLPLAISTASTGLYQTNGLALPAPTLKPQPATKTILIWGGASSVGSTAIQLAKASGLHVMTTASARNAAYVRSLGADVVLDYSKADIEAAVVAEIAKTESAGLAFAGAYDAISSDSTVRTFARIAAKAGLPSNTKVITVWPPPEDLEKSVVAEGIFGLSIATDDHKHVAEAVWCDFIPAALAAGVFQAKPDPLVAGRGLESIQKGFEMQKKGVSAKKVVVSL